LPALTGCGKILWHKPGLSGYLVNLVGLVQPNKQDRPDRPNEQDRLADFFSILLNVEANDHYEVGGGI